MYIVSPKNPTTKSITIRSVPRIKTYLFVANMLNLTFFCVLSLEASYISEYGGYLLPGVIITHFIIVYELSHNVRKRKIQFDLPCVCPRNYDIVANVDAI